MTGAAIVGEGLSKNYRRGLEQSTVSPALRGRIPELDGLRGIAISLVVIVHYFVTMVSVPPGSGVSYLLAAGRLAWTGVDLFFVLSGFLIGGILLDARESPNYFRVFYTRRFFRIVPAYTLALGFAFAATALIRPGGEESSKWLLDGQLPWWPHLLFLQNFWMAAANRLGSMPMGVTWSLAVEEQFYLTLPVLIWLIPVRRIAPVLAGGVLMAPALRIALYYFWPGHPVAAFVLMPCRADALLLGVLGALVIRDERIRTWFAQRHRILLFVILGLAAGMAVFTKYAPNSSGWFMATIGYSWVACFYACVLLCAVTQRESLLSRWLRWNWLGWVGTIAYGVYLFHQLILGLIFSAVTGTLPIIKDWHDFALTGLALALTLVFCRLLWIHFEKPLLQIGHSSSYMPVIGSPEA